MANQASIETNSARPSSHNIDSQYKDWDIVKATQVNRRGSIDITSFSFLKDYVVNTVWDIRTLQRNNRRWL